MSSLGVFDFLFSKARVAAGATFGLILTTVGTSRSRATSTLAYVLLTRGFVTAQREAFVTLAALNCLVFGAVLTSGSFPICTDAHV